MHGGTPAKAPAATPPRAPPRPTPSTKPSRGQALWARVARAAAVETLLAELVPAASSVDAGGEQAQRWLADRTARAAASLRAAELALSSTLGHRASARELRDDAAAGAATRRLEKLGALRDLGAGSPAVWVELLLEATDEGAKMGFRGFSRELLRVRQARCRHDLSYVAREGVWGEIRRVRRRLGHLMTAVALCAPPVVVVASSSRVQAVQSTRREMRERPMRNTNEMRILSLGDISRRFLA